MRASRSAPVVCFAASSIVAGVYILHSGHDTFFRADDWEMMVARRDLSPNTLLTPHAEHLVAFQILAFNLVRKVAGWHYGAYRLVMLVLHLAVTSCVFVFA
ncbi:MAG: hypothetical protein QOG86_939, partial [Thermoleophilaceae bacterium]|nr:hypothetical protein [Thermoleophilaceae bacterium]